MAQEVSRQFDTALGAVILTIRDEFGHDSLHTIHLVNDGVDVAAISAQLIAESDARTGVLKERLKKAGWQSQPA